MQPYQPPVRPFDRKLLAALTLGIVLLALVLILSRSSIQELQQTSSLARATEEFRRQLNAVAETILNMETGQRGYLLTSSAEYLEPYTLGREQIASEISGLQRLTADNQVQRENVAFLSALLDKRLGQMEHALDLYRADGIAAAMEFVRTNQGHVTMAQVRELLQRSSAEAERLLGERRSSEARSLQRNFWFTVTLSTLVVALMIVIYLLVRRETETRAHATEQLDRTNASLEARVRESTGHLSQVNETLKAEIEQRKQAESALRRSHDVLEERVRERTAELTEMSAARSRFLAAASHDLRQPLQSLMLLNATLRGHKQNPMTTRIIEAQQQSLDSMSRLVHALLNINRLQSGAVQPEIRDFPLAGMLEGLRTEFAPLARAKYLSLHIDESQSTVRSDPTLLREIVQNLLANAVRYTERGEIRVRTVATAERVRIEVADTGPGIPEDKQELIFEEFQQLKPTTGQRRESFGLGLSIVRHAARALGSKVELSSTLGAGATFSLSVPTGEAEIPAAQPRELHGEASHAPVGRILLVDDEAGVRNATALFLSISGHFVATASSPDEALASLSSTPRPDVIISDYQLGAAQNGGQLIEAIRNRLGTVVPAVILTGDTTRLSQQCTSLKNCRIFHKPVDAEALADHLQSVLSAQDLTTMQQRAI